MAMPEFTHCISQYYPNTEGKYVQKQKQTLLLLFIFSVQVCETCKFQLVCLHFEKKMWKGISQQFFILQAKFSLAQVATKNKIFLMNRSTKEKGSCETLKLFSFKFELWTMDSQIKALMCTSD
jgi:hypothetical protein